MISKEKKLMKLLNVSGIYFVLLYFSFLTQLITKNFVEQPYFPHIQPIEFKSFSGYGGQPSGYDGTGSSKQSGVGGGGYLIFGPPTLPGQSVGFGYFDPGIFSFITFLPNFFQLFFQFC